MPKEKIYDGSEKFDLQIGWRKDDPDVQIGISTHDGRSLADWLADNQEPAGLPQFDSIWGNFGRDGINRMIRMLRKARDEAYGRDE